MDRREIVRRAIEFDRPPRLPFWQHQAVSVVGDLAGIPDDVRDCWEMDRQVAGWFFDHAAPDDWGCLWSVTEQKNMGQVTGHPLADWARLDHYRPPDPREPYYYARLEAEMADAADRYVAVTSHFNLIERLHMLHGFRATLEDFYLEPAKIERVLDMILDFKLAQFAELHRRFGDRVHGLFLTDDWGSQEGAFISPAMFRAFFAGRYRQLAEAIHGYGWHFFLHSCGRINDLVPILIEAGVDVLNMQQPQAYDLVAFGQRFAGQVAFLTTADIQATLPTGNAELVRAEVRELVAHWSTPQGGFIVFNYGDPAALAVRPEMTEVMFREFWRLARYWEGQTA